MDNKDNINDEEKNTPETSNNNFDDNADLDELKKEIEAQMGDVQDILNGNKEKENVIDLSQVSASSSVDMQETAPININMDETASINTDMNEAAPVNTNMDESAPTEFDGGKTEIIQVVDREFTPEGIPESNDENAEGELNTGKKKKKRLSKKAKIIISSTIIGIIALLGIVLGVYIYKSGGNIQDALLNVASDVVGDQDPIFILLLGVSEDISTELTDTIILCGYNPDTQKAFMLSIPRDTFVGKSTAWANGYDKINAKYQSGVDKTVEAVEKLTGVNIDNYVVVKNNALPALVDAIGTVEFDVPIDMNYDDPTQDLHIHLEAGMQEIDGDKAEQLLRFRHNNNGTSYPVSYGDNDYGRMKTQREFIKVVAKNLVKLNNVSKLKSIASAVYENIETNLALGKILGYVPHALKFNVEDLRMEQLPGQSAMINQLWFYQANSKKTKELMDELIYDLGMEKDEQSKYYTAEIDETKVIENKAKAEKEDDEEDDITTKVDRSNNDSITSDKDLKEYIKTQEETIKANKETTVYVNPNNGNTNTNQTSGQPVSTPKNDSGSTNTTPVAGGQSEQPVNPPTQKEEQKPTGDSDPTPKPQGGSEGESGNTNPSGDNPGEGGSGTTPTQEGGNPPEPVVTPEPPAEPGA